MDNATTKRIEFFPRMVAHLNAGGVAAIYALGRVTIVERKHVGALKIDSSGSMYLRDGKRWDCIDYCPIKLGRRA